MTFKILDDTANKLAVALIWLSSRFVVAFLTNWYVYSAATGFYHCAHHWLDFCYAVPFVAPILIFAVATDSEGGDPRLTDILWLTLIVTMIWTAIAVMRRYRSSQSLPGTDAVAAKHSFFLNAT